MKEEIERILFVSTSNPKARDAISFLARNFPEAKYFVLKITRTPAMEEVPEEVQLIADEAFLAILEEFSRRGIPVEKGETKKVGSREIVDLSPDFDLICIPTTILVKHTERVSSTTKEVLAKSKANLLVYSSFSKISEKISDAVVFYDGSSLSINAIKQALEFCEENSASLHIFLPKDERKDEVEKIIEEAKVPIDIEEIERKDALKFLREEETDCYFLTKRFPGKGGLFPALYSVSPKLLEFLKDCPKMCFIVVE